MRVLFSVLAVFSFFFFVPMKINAEHKPVSKSTMVYVFKECFKDAGGIEAAQFLLAVMEEENQDYFKTEEDLRLLFKTVGKDYDKAIKASERTTAVIRLFNSGMTAKAAIRLVREAEEAGVNIESSSLIILHAFRARGKELAEADTTLIERSLRQAEFLLHIEDDRNNLSFFGEELDWNLIFKEKVSSEKRELLGRTFPEIRVLEVTPPLDNLIGIEE